MQQHLILVLKVACLFLLTSGVATVAGAKRRLRRDVEARQGPTDEQIWDSGLVEKSLSFVTLLEKGREYYQDTSTRRSKGFVLGYVTPWNAAGYSNAVTFRHKLDAVAPVWFQIKQQEGAKKPEMLGGHEVNQTWMAELREGGRGPLVVPRFIMEGRPMEHVQMLNSQGALVEGVVAAVNTHGFDGIVLEAWAAWHSFNGIANEQFHAAAVGMLRLLSEALKRAGGKKLFLAVPPLMPVNEKAPWFDVKDYILLADIVDGFSMMTYDHSTTAGHAGPNAPLSWLTVNLQMLKGGPNGDNPSIPAALHPKLLMGLNFYGWDFSPVQGGVSAVTAPALQTILRRYSPALSWSAEHSEHSFTYKDREGIQHSVWYPTPRSVEMRLQLARENGVGISIWELGQGLERFFDLL